MRALCRPAAIRNPQSGETGYSITRDLDGFVYEVWEDTHGFDTTDGRPRRGDNINRTVGANGVVDLWDKHTRYTVSTDPDEILVEEITYSPDGSGDLNETVSSSTTLTGTGVHSELGGKTITEIQQNIANWYQYQRRRSFAAKSAIGNVVAANPGFRYGLSVINEYSSLFDEVPTGTSGFSAHNTNLLDSLFKLDQSWKTTPLRQGLERAGKYFDGDLAGKSDPIQYQCQQNFTILMTDGYWNGSNPAAAISDADGDGHSNTLADVAK